MPGYVMTSASTTLCAHGGHASAATAQPRVRLSGQPVVLQPIPFLVTGCVNPPPPNGVGPCVTAVWSTGTVRVRCSGLPLLVQDSVSICTPTGTPLTMVASQVRVTAQ